MRPEIALAFVGAVVPDRSEYRTPAFNRAGNNFQLQLIQGLAGSGVPDIEVLSALPIPSFPRSPAFWVPARRGQLDRRIPFWLVPFPNVTPLKQIVIGLDVMFGLIGWGWRNRKARGRVVLAYNLGVPPGLFTLVGARMARAKAVVSVNDVNIPGETVPSSALWRLDMRLQRWLLPKFDGHLAVSDQIATDFFPRRPYLRIEGGVDSTFLERTERPIETDAATKARFVFASAGGLNEANGIPIMLAAFEMLRRHNFRLRIAGTGPLQGMVEEATRRNPQIEYLGMLEPTGVADLYNSADVLLNVRLTKRIDTRYFFPSKLIEYLASGVPTITTSVGHVEKEFGDFVYILHDESADGLAAVMSSVASQGLDKRMRVAKKARAYMATNKNWEVHAAKVVTYLRELVRSTEAPQPPSDLYAPSIR